VQFRRTANAKNGVASFGSTEIKHQKESALQLLGISEDRRACFKASRQHATIRLEDESELLDDVSNTGHEISGRGLSGVVGFGHQAQELRARSHPFSMVQSVFERCAMAFRGSVVHERQLDGAAESGERLANGVKNVRDELLASTDVIAP
jgi:phosphoglycerate dehydrogenase-like enzyme